MNRETLGVGELRSAMRGRRLGTIILESCWQGLPGHRTRWLQSINKLEMHIGDFDLSRRIQEFGRKGGHAPEVWERLKSGVPARSPLPIIGLLACLWVMGCGPKAQHPPDRYANEAARYEAYRIADLFGIAAEHYYSHHGTLPIERGAIEMAFSDYCDKKLVVDGKNLKITAQVINSDEVKAPFKQVKVSVEYLGERQSIISEQLLAKPEEATQVYWIWRDDNQVLVETEDNLADMLAIMSFDYKEDNGKWPQDVDDLERHTWYSIFTACSLSKQLSLDVTDRFANVIIVNSKSRRYVYDEKDIDKSLPPRIKRLR